MRTIENILSDGRKVKEKIYNVLDYPLEELLSNVDIVPGKQGIYYYNIPAAFDIETSSIHDDDIHYGFMYNWQFCIADTVCMGRCWDDFVKLLERITPLGSIYLPVYVHNLGFEFQFMRMFFEWDTVFSRAERTPMYARTGRVEFRCSYLLSNRGLKSYCNDTPTCVHKKLSGDDFDYTKIRTPKTRLSEKELQYCYNDVAGLCECIAAAMKDDTLGTIPLTSTGYVRREVRATVLENPKNNIIVKQLRLWPEQYEMAKHCFRGGNTACNPVYAKHLLDDIESYDLESSYPAVLLTEKFPMTKFRRFEPQSLNHFDRIVQEKACMIHVVFRDIEVRNMSTIVYIPRSKCEYIEKGKFFNGRVISAKVCSMYLTDIDYKIIRDTYKIEGGISILDCYVAEYGYLPLELRKAILEYYTRKCELKDEIKAIEARGEEVPIEMEENYTKFKNKVNAIFGMMVTDIVSPEIIYDNGWDTEDIDVATALNKYYRNKKSFTSYQWGVWTTAHARKRLQDCIEILGNDIIYVDTDSVKFFRTSGKTAEIEKLNIELEKKLHTPDLDCVVVSKHGKVHLPGTWDKERHIDRFKTYGAKKYCCEYNGKSKITIAGLSKEKGSKYLNDIGGIEMFEIGLVWDATVSGRTTSWFNDDDIHTINVDGVDIKTAANIAVENTTYTLDFTDIYLK